MMTNVINATRSNMTNDLFDEIKIRFEEFLSLIGVVLVHEKDIHLVQNKLRRHFNIASSIYLCSEEFQTLLDRTHKLFNKNEKSLKHFSLLVSIDDELKKHGIASIRSNQSSKTTTVKNCTIDESSSSSALTNPIDSAETPTTTTTCEPIVSSSEDPPAASTIKLRGTNNEFKRQRKIKKLEKRLSRLANIICELEERDMSLDEMEHCDLYVVESNFKKRACEVYKKLTELKNGSTSTERVLHRRLILSATEIGHPLIAAALQTMVNDVKFFPSFADVLDCVEQVNEEKNLQLNAETRTKLAEKSFKIIGKQIKTRRMSDFHDIMRSRLPENFDIDNNDPALHNADIQTALVENQRQAMMKTEKIFEEFSQFDPELQDEVTIESSDDSSNETEDSEANDSDNQSISEHEQHETQYDSANIFSSINSQPASPIPELIVESVQSVDHKDHEEYQHPTSSSDQTFTVISTAMLPQRTTQGYSFKFSQDHNRVDSLSVMKDKHCQRSTTNVSSTKILPAKSPTVLIPRRREHSTSNEIIYNLYQKCLTNPISFTNQKRPLSVETNYHSTGKKAKERQPDLVVLD